MVRLPISSASEDTVQARKCVIPNPHRGPPVKGGASAPPARTGPDQRQGKAPGQGSQGASQGAREARQQGVQRPGEQGRVRRADPARHEARGFDRGRHAPDGEATRQILIEPARKEAHPEPGRRARVRPGEDRRPARAEDARDLPDDGAEVGTYSRSRARAPRRTRRPGTAAGPRRSARDPEAARGGPRGAWPERGRARRSSRRSAQALRQRAGAAAEVEDPLPVCPGGARAPPRPGAGTTSRSPGASRGRRRRRRSGRDRAAHQIPSVSPMRKTHRLAFAFSKSTAADDRSTRTT